jgi:type I restriction-modification system DNA methylase subunit
MTKFNLKYLEDKLGTFQKEYQYPTKPISGFNLIYIETQTKAELDGTIKKVEDEMNPGFIWGYVKDSNAIYIKRAFGENKIFIYNPTTIKKTDYVKGKLKVLNNLTADNINDLFDQKAVFDYFYRKLWDIRLDLGKEIRDRNNITDNIALMTAQHIMDRIIFTYFICEKDLVTLNDEIAIDSKTLFKSISKMPDPWGCLKNLFFEQFAKKESIPLLLGKNAQITTPYLNGGLFRPKIIEGISEIDLNIQFSTKQWQDLFEPLNKYTWIIEEEIPDYEGEYEGNLTPEIIGHIYEKFVISMETLDEINIDELNISKSGDLKRGNKKIGAYYTPEKITEYISKNTILPILYDKLGQKKDQKFNNFVKNSDSKTLEKALNILDNITICDPACGSGAFLIKAGEILLKYKIEICKHLKNKKINRYKLKKEIIINNVYGVDIQEGAVEICKLRLWLWLISSYQKGKKVDQLPNIEYNFTIGNSLVGWVNEELNQNVLIKLDDMILTVLDALKIHYKNYDIDFIKEKLKSTDMQSYADAMSLLKKVYSYATEEEAEQLKSIIENIKNAIYIKIDGIFYNFIKSQGTKITQDEYLDLNPFHWKIDFSNIFENGGFDVIIGNPPYLTFSRVSGSKGMEKTLFKSYKQYLNDIYPYSAEYKISTYAVFMNRGISLLNRDGMISYITPDSFLIGRYYSKLRKYILENCKIIELTIFCQDFWKVGVIGFPVISILKHESNPEIRNKNKLKAIKTKSLEAFAKNLVKTYQYEQMYFDGIQFNRFRLFFDEFSKYFVEKIEDNSVPAGDIVSLHVGIRPKIGYKNISSKIPKNNHWKKGMIAGNEITRYNVNYQNNYINLDPELLWAGGYDKNIIRKEKLLMRKTGDNLIVALDKNKLYHLDILHSIILKNQNYSLNYIMTIFNSKLMNHYYRLITLSKGRAMAQTNMETIEQLPIRKTDSMTCKLIDKYVEELIKLKQIFTNEINDFKEFYCKKFEVEKFPKSLENYYNLNYDDLIKVMKKSKTNFEFDDLESQFTNSCKKLYPITNEIKLIEYNINKMIYSIYELNESEIEIIENKCK